MSQPVSALLVGAGLRGRMVYGGWAKRNSEQLRITALAEPDAERRESTAREHGLAPERIFRDWRDALSVPRLADAVATDDRGHTGPALAAFERGYHVLLEKPIAPSVAECARVVRAARDSRRILQVAHVLRYTRFYSEIAKLLKSGQLGRVQSVDMKEHVAAWHFVHSYVRGKFRNREVAAPIILAKCCHDLDLLCWLVDAPVSRLASFGTLAHFNAANAPEGAPLRCSEGCPVQERCPWDVQRFYLGVDDALARGWPWVDVSPDPSREARRESLLRGRYGRCVYRCDNNVPDRQVVSFEFAGGALATLGMQGFSTRETRTIRVSGSEGELRGVLADGLIEVHRHDRLDVQRVECGSDPLGHHGGDEGMLEHFTDVVRRDAIDEARTSGAVSLESHLLGFAAEKARLEARVIDFAEFRRSAPNHSGDSESLRD